MANIKVAVRVRPISAREVNLTGSEVVVRTGLKEISLTNLKVSSSKAGDSRERTRRYVFDYCFDSSEQQAENYADQGKIYETLGQTVLDAVFSGYNSCLVAYGQSASGKTYTMMGTKDDPGLTPRLCGGLFSRVDEEQENNGKTYRISVSYLEIYNERVRDLLKPSASKGGLRVREHPRLGPYVQGLTHHVVRTLGSLMSYVEEGTRARKTASTLQNPSSSRSHALLTVSVHPESSSVPGHPVTSSSGSSASRRKEISSRANSGGSKLHLVDLAGSESAATCGGIHRLKEGANINKSLVALGNVISALAERGSTGSGPGRRFIPYRDSSLTWLLKDALGGNATTIMLATISPASGSYNETAHTLRFAQRAQSVVNRPVVNEDPVARIIRELRDEVARLKSLLLQQNLQGDSKALCFCGRSQTDEKSNRLEEESRVDESSRSVRKQEDGVERSLDKRRIEGSIRRSNSSDSLTTCEVDSTIKRYGSCEFLASKDRFKGSYNRAKVTELNDEEDEVSEINESVFVDIPTLVAVLIKPDDTLQESSTQIEEICSDEVAEDSIDVEFIEGVAGERSVYEEGEKSESIGERSSSVNSCNASGDTEIEVCPVEERGSILKEKGKFRKQDSMDVGTTPSNLHTSKRFGSVETIQKKKEPIFALERSNTNLEKRSSGDRAKKLNNIREIEDHKTSNRIANLWRDDVNGKDRLQRKGSNDSDKSSKESGSLSSIKTTNNTRKPSLESLKRKTSKDSSSSSSKEEQILISSLTREKLLHRKNSLEQEPAIRAHTPIQRAKRAEIVAAVTERLYSSRKQQEESASASGIRSPPEGTDVKTGSAIGARSKLQELSRRMLGKRRRVCVDTQTESSRTIRMKDSACSTETPTIICQDVAVLTENHEDCEISGDRVPVLRVKEIATSTEKPKTDIVRRKDVAILANDLEFYDYDVHSPRNDSGILSDDAQNYAGSTLSSAEISEFCAESNRRIVCTDNSTNTLLLANRSSAVQTTRQEVVGQRAQENKSTNCVGHCCGSVHESCKSVPVSNSERNVISISLPDMINITIESTNVLESRIVMDNSDSTEERIKACTKDREVQTSKINDVREETRFCFKDFIRSTSSQTDGRGFRIENIFQDPNNSSRSCTKIDMASDSMESKRTRNSVTFRNSLGTLYANDSKQDERIVEKYDCFPEARSFVKDGLITEAFISKKRCFNVGSKRRPQSIVYNDPWKNWMASCPANSTQPVNYARDVGNLSSLWQQNHQIPMADFSMNCANCAGVVSASGAQDFGQSQQASVWSDVEETTDLNSSLTRLEATVVPDHDHGFSDDSLDYNENQISKDTSASKAKKEGDHENRENLCPPDVVAHTKKEILKTSGTVDVESTILGDFEDVQVEIPKKKPDEPLTSSPVHDYKAIILGKTTCAVHESADDESTCGTAEGKKKVSFSNSDVFDKRKDQRRSKQESNPPKSIIKKRKKKSSMENAVQSSNDETDDSQQEEKTGANLENACRSRDRRGRGRSGNLEDSSKIDKDFDDSNEESKETNRKKVKFTVECVSKDSSDPENNENTEDEDEDVENETSSSRNILEEYLDEAVTFMRNMNSINEYMSATRMFEKSLGRGKRRGSRRKNSSSRGRDYVEFQGRRISLKDDTEEDLNEDEEDVGFSMESYERCLRGIQRVEDCIRKVDKQNELLREKYGINCESTGARLNLASPSVDHRVFPTTRNDLASSRTSSDHDLSVPRMSLSSWCPSGVGSPRSNASDNVEMEDDDIEKRIYQQLMNVADSTRYWNSRRLRQERSLKVADGSRSPKSCFKYRDKSNLMGGEVRKEGSFRVEDEFVDLGECETSRSKTRMRLPRFEDDFDFDEDYTINFDDREDSRIRKDISLMRTNGVDSLTFDVSRLGTSDRIDEDDAEWYLKSSIGFPVASLKKRNHEIEDFARKRDIDAKVYSFGEESLDIDTSKEVPATNTTSTEDISHFRDKLKYPGSPRARFLELLRERRRIVESSRGTGAS